VVEALTNAIEKRAWKHIQEVEQMGGMAKAIESGLPKLRIEEAATRRQAQIDSGVESIIGVNLHRLEKFEPLEVLEVNNEAVRVSQRERLDQLRRSRNADEVARCLEALTKCANGENGNLLGLAVEAARARATLGEISLALEKSFGRHKAQIKSVSGVYQAEYSGGDLMDKIQKLIASFVEKEGRRPRILITKLGQDGHDRGAKVVATAYADFGFDVDIGPLFQTPEEAARMAVENDVHVIGVSSLAGGHKALVPQLRAELKKHGREDIMIIVGGVIPAQDYEFLKSNGAAAIFGPGTVLPEAAREILEELHRRV
jgi:methylmalonyl-CoA mutase